MPLVAMRRRGLRVLEWAAKACSDYCDVLVADGPGSADAVRRLWAGIVAAGGFDLSYLSHVRPDSPVSGLVTPTSRGSTLVRGRRREVNLRVQGPWASGRAWMDSLPKKPRQNYRRGWKALGEGGEARFRRVGPDEPVGPIVDRLAQLKRDWLARTGLSSTLLGNDAAPLKALVDVLSRAGLLHLFVIELDGTVVAGSVNFVEADRMMAFFAAYDPAHERASLGMLLMADYMQWAFDHGIGEIDFLCGAEEYKLRYANSRRELASFTAGRTLLGQAAIALDGMLAPDAGWRAALGRVTGRTDGEAAGALEVRRS